MNSLKKEKGFTIIEVVLVLAIAGLIFLMVFIALPALQRNQRDGQRKNDMSRLQTAVVNYGNSNRGQLPGTTVAQWTSFVNTYLLTGGDTFIDPSGALSGQAQQSAYNMRVTTTATLSGGFASTTEGQNVINVSLSSVCGGTPDTIASAGSRKVAFRMAMESGGYYCVNN
jgi:prepilin-type N-terminal cleavage/methylation domain-containing protein